MFYLIFLNISFIYFAWMCFLLVLLECLCLCLFLCLRIHAYVLIQRPSPGYKLCVHFFRFQCVFVRKQFPKPPLPRIPITYPLQRGQLVQEGGYATHLPHLLLREPKASSRYSFLSGVKCLRVINELFTIASTEHCVYMCIFVWISVYLFKSCGWDGRKERGRIVVFS